MLDASTSAWPGLASAVTGSNVIASLRTGAVPVAGP
jgi:hypothetical protein